MASSEDFKRILELYNQEVKSSGISIVSFCQQNGIVYSQFERWYKNRKKVKVHPVQIVDKNGMSQSYTDVVSSTSLSTASPALDSENEDVASTASPFLFSVTIRTSSGLSLQQSHLSYRQLQALVEKLEVLC